MAELRAEMAANVWKVLVTDGDAVTPGQTLVILESMKMEINVDAETGGTVTIAVSEGQAIQEDDLIATVE